MGRSYSYICRKCGYTFYGSYGVGFTLMQPEMNVIRAIIDARISQNMSQKELSERTGIAQTEISKLENGTRNPSIKLLQRLADGILHGDLYFGTLPPHCR